VITRAGDEALRSALVVGGTSVIQHALRSGKASPWFAALLKRKSPKLAAVALTNKTARTAWKMMVTGRGRLQREARGRRVEIGQTRGATKHCNRAEARTCEMMQMV
jgi:hypothetical protein